MLSEKQKIYKERWKKKYPEKQKESHRNYIRNRRQKQRLEVITYYGGKCNKCGFTDIRALQIDHINGGGTKHKKEIKTFDLCHWIIRNKYPKGFQVLCANCNWVKRFENNEVRNGFADKSI